MRSATILALVLGGMLLALHFMDDGTAATFRAGLEIGNDL